MEPFDVGLDRAVRPAESRSGPATGAPMIAALATPANMLAARPATPARIEAPIATECPPMPFGLRYALASGRHARRTAQSSQMLRIARDDTLRRRKLTIEKFISRLNALGRGGMHFVIGAPQLRPISAALFRVQPLERPERGFEEGRLAGMTFAAVPESFRLQPFRVARRVGDAPSTEKNIDQRSAQRRRRAQAVTPPVAGVRLCAPIARRSCRPAAAPASPEEGRGAVWGASNSLPRRFFRLAERLRAPNMEKSLRAFARCATPG